MNFITLFQFDILNKIPMGKVKSILNFAILNFGIYLTWIGLHYVASHLYIHWCVPATLTGLLMSPFLVPAPHCFGLRWLIYHGGNSIIVMWSFIGIWLLSYIVPIQH
jgi:hypothetical protein